MRWACGTQCLETEFQQGKVSINTFLSIASLLGFEGVEFDAKHLPSIRPNYAQILLQQLGEQELATAVISYQVTTPKALSKSVEPIMTFAKMLRSRALCLVGAADWNSLADEIKELAQVAENLSLPLGLSLPTEIGASRKLCDLLDDIASPYLGVCMEVEAETSPENEFWQDLVTVAPFTLHVHLRFSKLAKSLTWLPVIELLREVEYEGFISVVQVPEPAEESLKVLSSQLSSFAR